MKAMMLLMDTLISELRGLRGHRGLRGLFSQNRPTPQVVFFVECAKKKPLHLI